MKNILSYPYGTVFTGKEIREWITYQIKNNTSHLKQAIHMQKFNKMKDERKYVIDMKIEYNWSHCKPRKQVRVRRIGKI